MFRLLVLFLTIGFVISFCRVDFSHDIRSASRESAQIAPSTNEVIEPIVQIYEAREFKWKGLIATHSWIAIKPSYSRHYTIYQINRFLAPQNISMIEIKEDLPDRFWFGNKPRLVCDLRGKAAASAIRKIKQLVQEYPYKNKYDFFLGPNANTFTNYILTNLDETKAQLSPLAIGKDFHESFISIQPTSSHTGYKLCVKGMLAVEFGKTEGFNLSLFGITLGLNIQNKQLVLPLVGLVDLP